MKSSSDIRPAAFVPLGNGAYHYNFFITEDKAVDTGGESGATPRTVYNYDTVKVWAPVTFQNLVRAVIREEIDETEEFNMVNDFNAAKEGIITGDEAARAIQGYREYLNFVADIKGMIRSDIAAQGR